MELAEKFDISSVPTFILFKDGKEIDRVSGSTTKKSFMKWLNKYLNIKDK